MKVLVAFESSGTVRDAFIAAGHDAISCDLLASESPGPSPDRGRLRSKTYIGIAEAMADKWSN